MKLVESPNLSGVLAARTLRGTVHAHQHQHGRKSWVIAISLIFSVCAVCWVLSDEGANDSRLSLLLSKGNVDKVIRELQDKIKQEKFENHQLFKDIVDQTEHPLRKKEASSKAERREPSVRNIRPAISLPDIQHLSDWKHAALQRISEGVLPSDVSPNGPRATKSGLNAAGGGTRNVPISGWPTHRDTSIQWPSMGSALTTSPFRFEYPSPVSATGSSKSLTPSSTEAQPNKVLAQSAANQQPAVSWQEADSNKPIQWSSSGSGSRISWPGSHQLKTIEREIQGIKSLILKSAIKSLNPSITSERPTISSAKPTITSETPTITSETPTITSENPIITTVGPIMQQGGQQASKNFAFLNAQTGASSLSSLPNTSGILWPQQDAVAKTISWPVQNGSKTEQPPAFKDSHKYEQDDLQSWPAATGSNKIVWPQQVAKGAEARSVKVVNPPRNAVEASSGKHTREYIWPGAGGSKTPVKPEPLKPAKRAVRFGSSAHPTAQQATEPTDGSPRQPKSVWEAVHVHSVLFFLCFGLACFALGGFTGARWCLPAPTGEPTEQRLQSPVECGKMMEIAGTGGTPLSSTRKSENLRRSYV